MTRKRRKPGRPKKEDAERYESGRAKTDRPTTAESRVNAMATAISARARRAGESPATVTHSLVDRFKAPWHGCAAGKAIAHEKDTERLWDTITTIRSRRAGYIRAVDAPPPHPKAGGLQYVPDRVEVTPDTSPVDLRSDEEKADQAIAAWESVSNRLHQIHPLAVRMVLNAIEADEVRSIGGLNFVAVIREMAAWMREGR